MNYLNLLGEAKSFGHCKAHVLAEMIKSQQIEPADRKTVLKTFLNSEKKQSFSEFLQSIGVKLSKINWYWAARFNNRMRDKYTYLLDETEMKEYKTLWSAKNKRSLYHFHELP